LESGRGGGSRHHCAHPPTGLLARAASHPRSLS
jgi:hypothetical protein